MFNKIAPQLTYSLTVRRQTLSCYVRRQTLYGITDNLTLTVRRQTLWDYRPFGTEGL